jgi:thiol-disulfide isomerase/thioredoxin
MKNKTCIHRVLSFVVLSVMMGLIFQLSACNLTKNSQLIQEEALGIPRMIDFGSTMCIPCKEMEPILEELQIEYKDRLLIEFIDVTKNQDKSREYGINVIPTQIFFDEEGKEFFRHIGFFSKEDILKTFTDHSLEF